VKNDRLQSKKFIPHLAIEKIFLKRICKSLYDVKPKGAVRAVCTLLRIWLLSAQWAITIQDGALALKGSHTMGAGRFF
jgi:hypothetical protein